MTRNRSADAWPVRWSDATDALIDSTLAATPAQRLEWLEAAMHLAYGAGALRTAEAPPAGVADIPANGTAEPHRGR